MWLRSIASALTVTVALAGFALPASAQQAAPEAQIPALPPPAVLPAVPTIAPGYAPPATPALPNGELVGVAQEPFVGVKLDDAIAMALARNTDLAVAESNERIANYEIVAAKGAYDVQFELVPQYSHAVEPAESLFQSGPNGGPITQISRGVAAQFSGETALGTRYALGASQSVVNNDTVLNSYDPFYNTSISLNLTQPLLRGSGAGDPAHRQLIVSSEQATQQAAVLLTQASQTITDVSNTYWDLVAAWRNVGIQEQGLRNATAQAQSNQRLAQRGAAAPVDVIESTTQINVFQDNVFSALQQVQALQSQLKSEILANPADPLWTANLVPTSAVLQLPTEPALNDLIVSALKNRPEVAQLRSQRLIDAANVAYAKNQTLPQVDLGAGVTSTGFAGVQNNFSNAAFFQFLTAQANATNALVNAYNAGGPATPIATVVPNFGSSPSFQTGKFGQSWQNALDFRFPTYSLSLTLHFPIQNRTAKADLAVARESERAVSVQEVALIQRIRAEATNAIQSLREAQYRLAAATAARSAAERVLASEQRRFSAGTSTTFLILQRQLDLANTEGRELSAQTDLNKAVVQLNQVAGTNFAAYHIDIKTLGAKTLDGVSPATDVLPLPADAQASPPPPHR